MDALRIAVPESKMAKDPNIHLMVTGLLDDLDSGNELAVPDTEWVERKTKENQREIDRLEHELRGYKNNLIKESIRMGQEDLAMHYLSMSDFENSQKAFQKMREYCTTPKHIAEMTIKLMFTSIASSQWVMLKSHCQRVSVMQLKPEDKDKFEPAVEACLGLAYLGTSDYRGAAETFLRVNQSFTANESVAGINFPKAVLTGNDIAVYGGLCALATMNREELKTTVLESSDFRTFLELEPHVRRAISFFCDGKYSQCLAILESYRNDYQLDIYLGEHLGELYQRIRSKSIIQYFVPFSQVSLAALAAAFPLPNEGNTTTELMTSELIDMIQSGLLNARIDTVNQSLMAPHKDTRVETQQNVLETAYDIEHKLRVKLHKMNMFQAGLELQNPKGAKGSKISSGMNPWESGAGMSMEG